MKMKHITEKAGRSMSGSVGIGALIAVAVSVIMAMALSALIVNERIDEDVMQYFSFAILLVSAFAGCMLAGKRTEGKYAMATGLTALTYCVILMGAGILLFDGGFRNLWTSIIAIMIGCVLSCAICIGGQGKGHRRKWRPR